MNPVMVLSSTPDLMSVSAVPDPPEVDGCADQPCARGFDCLNDGGNFTCVCDGVVENSVCLSYPPVSAGKWPYHLFLHFIARHYDFTMTWPVVVPKLGL